MKKIPKLFFMKKMTVAAIMLGALIIFLSVNVYAVPIEKAVAKKAEVAKAVPWSYDANQIIPAPVISSQVQVVNNTTGDPIKKAKIQAWQKANSLYPDGVPGILTKTKAAANKKNYDKDKPVNLKKQTNVSDIIDHKDAGQFTDTSPINIADVSTPTTDKWNNAADDTSPGKINVYTIKDEPALIPTADIG